jgi:flagellar hook-length control protein FliK
MPAIGENTTAAEIILPKTSGSSKTGVESFSAQLAKAADHSQPSSVTDTIGDSLPLAAPPKTKADTRNTSKTNDSHSASSTSASGHGSTASHQVQSVEKSAETATTELRGIQGTFTHLAATPVPLPFSIGVSLAISTPITTEPGQASSTGVNPLPTGNTPVSALPVSALPVSMLTSGFQFANFSGMLTGRTPNTWFPSISGHSEPEAAVGAPASTARIGSGNDRRSDGETVGSHDEAATRAASVVSDTPLDANPTVAIATASTGSAHTLATEASVTSFAANFSLSSLTAESLDATLAGLPSDTDESTLSGRSTTPDSTPGTPVELMTKTGGLSEANALRATVISSVGATSLTRPGTSKPAATPDVATVAGDGSPVHLAGRELASSVDVHKQSQHAVDTNHSSNSSQPLNETTGTEARGSLSSDSTAVESGKGSQPSGDGKADRGGKHETNVAAPQSVNLAGKIQSADDRSGFANIVAQQGGDGLGTKQPVSPSGLMNDSGRPGVDANTHSTPAGDIDQPLAQSSQSGPLSALRTAKLFERAGQSELHVGFQAGELGTVDIRTSMVHNQVTAEISVERGELRNLLAAELPNLQQKLAAQQVTAPNIVLNHHSGGSSADSQQAYRQNERAPQGSTSRPSVEEVRPGIQSISETQAPSTQLDVHM